MSGCRQHFGDIGFLKYKKMEVEKMAGEIFFQNRRILAIWRVYFFACFSCVRLGPTFDDIFKTFIEIVLNQEPKYLPQN